MKWASCGSGCINSHGKLGMPSKKKIAQKVTLEHSHLFPSPLAQMGQEKLGHKKLFTDPLTPSGNRDKLHLSRETVKIRVSSRQLLYYMI